jgi:hypothetical protein
MWSAVGLGSAKVPARGSHTIGQTENILVMMMMTMIMISPFGQCGQYMGHVMCNDDDDNDQPVWPQGRWALSSGV